MDARLIRATIAEQMSAPEVNGRRDVARFGEFEVDLSRHTLSRCGDSISLQRQPLKVLELLVQRAPDIVSRDEIRRHVWGNDIYVDSAQNINFCIRQIRAALGDTAEGRLIETFPRQGYRFVAPLDAAPESTSASENSPDAVSRPGTSSRWLITSLCALVSLGLGAEVWRWVARRIPESAVVRITPITSYPGDEREPSLSPDGRQVAFSWGGENGENRDIYVAMVGEQNPMRLTSDPAQDAWPAWSPNGRQIAFIRRQPGFEADIMLVPALGGPQTKLREIRLGEYVTGPVLAWTPDGKQLCFTSEVGPAGHHRLFLLTIESGTVRQILPAEDNSFGDWSPAISPDGKWLAFARFEHPLNSKLLLQRLSRDLTPEGRQIVVKDAGINPASPVWMPDGKRILFLDRSRIMETTIGGPARLLYLSDGEFSALTVSAVSSRVIASLQNRRAELWSIPLIAGGMKAGGEPKPLVRSNAGEGQPRFSPDGRWLAFVSKRSGSPEVWLADSDGNNPRQLTHSSFYIAGYVRWSSDSRFLAFHARLPKDPQLYVVGIGDGVVRQVTRSGPGFTAPSWSMDGQTLYADTLENGTNRTYSVPVAGGAPRFLFLKASGAVEVPGRQLLIYEKADEPGIYARSLTGELTKNPEQLLVADYRPPSGGFQPVAEGIYYAGSDSHGVIRAIRFYSFATGRSVDVAPAPTQMGLSLAVTPDRTRMAYSDSSRRGEHLIQIEFR
jgi:Tol biopolymer transport system component/DNA-binding winged helix-turn-helix (wHTH) protein